MSSILLVTHCFPADADDLVGNFLYDFCLALKQIEPEVKITVFTPKMNSEYDRNYLARAVDYLQLFKWLGGKKRLAELKLKKISDVLQLFSIFYHGRKALNTLLKNNRYDFVLAPWVIPNGYYISALSQKYKTPFALWALGSDLNVYGKKPGLKNLVKSAYKNCALSYTNSRAMQLLIENRYQKKSSLLYTNRKLSSPDVEYQDKTTFRLVFVGRLEKVKGPDLLLEALIASGLQDFSLEVIGDGSLRSTLESTALSNNLNKQVIFHGRQNGEFIADKLKQADYLIISSLAEGMPVVFWEAMQCGTPVVSTDVGDVKFYCDSYNVGRVCEVNSRSLADQLLFLSQFKVLRKVLSENTQILAEMSDISKSAQIFLQDIKNINN